ncbi:glycoside hydrolase family 127 protein [Phaeodactylibacter xiamenensis]|uniref:glycoside hydrolase family 127 protein n=1 Tax=Phaeodactylibacter xiamenensis TaxID=1524460 RepID=UPI0024A8DDBA|nr:beta-L-arabinofuranosidase domain-containing protein [Phaeodactylibacter xiamenensis]
MKHTLYLAILSCFVFSCSTQETQVEAEVSKYAGYRIAPVDIQHVRMTDDFWLPIIKRVQEHTIVYALDKCEEEGRMENFLIAGGKLEGATRGAMPFDDTDLYKIIEGASNSLISAPNPELERTLDTLIDIIAVGQEADGYLTTWRTIAPAKPPAPWVKVIEGKRWESLEASHEMYNPGHLYEAAYTHYIATGKTNFLNIALKNADLLVKTFGDGEGQISTVPGHQIIETGLIKLYMASGEEKYLHLAKYFLDNRGNPDNHELFGPYAQDHLPVVEQKEVVGHAVRAVYMYAAMTDIAVLMRDSAYDQAVQQLWENMVGKKMYLTGGIGARHDGESFGDNYELPNLTAYSETCAAIGSVYWNHRLHRQYGDVKYYDIIERTLYNGLIAGLSLDGTHFFYPNALEADGKYEFNRGACTRQGWFDCSCCPTNMIRFIPAVAGLLYSKTEDTLLVNLYAGSEATVELSSNNLKIKQETNYPWSGKVRLTVSTEAPNPVMLKLRIPSWARNEVAPGGLYQYQAHERAEPTLKIDGEPVALEVAEGYILLTRDWSKGATLELELPTTVRKVRTDERVEANLGKLALEYGPIVYAVESFDNPNVFENLSIAPDDTFEVRWQPELLGGVNTITNNQLTAIPYYAWSNRGIGKMKVWLPKPEIR